MHPDLIRVWTPVRAEKTRQFTRERQKPCAPASELAAHGTSRYRMSRRSGIRFVDKDMRQYWNLRRFPFILNHSVIEHERETP
jgi:hypothetical protein